MRSSSSAESREAVGVERYGPAPVTIHLTLLLHLACGLLCARRPDPLEAS